MTGDGRDAGQREIVVALVAPVGSPMDDVTNEIRSAFERNGHSVSVLRISALLDTAVSTLPDESGLSRARMMMNKGDRFRVAIDDEGACGFLAAVAIHRERSRATGSPRKHRSEHVVILRSLKTPEEVSVLRSIYGERLIVVGVGAPEQVRRESLIRELSVTMDTATAAQEAAYLIARDEHDQGKDFGQRMRKAHRLADVFIPAATPGALKPLTSRLVDLLLGSPWITPEVDEQGMFFAWSAKFRSSAAGRQVGAAVVDERGEVVVTGMNDVPKPHGGQYWPTDSPDRRDFQLGYDANDRGKFDMALRVLQDLADGGWLSSDRQAMQAEDRANAALDEDGPLNAGRLSDLIEFGRIVHAEMAALMTAAREGRSVSGCTLYTTTYPCHECARLIIAAGIRRVVFIDPYEKSRAPEMFSEMFDGRERQDGVHVVPFEGVSPRLFPRAFEQRNRSKGPKGEFAEWVNRRLITQNEELSDSIPLQEEAAIAYLSAAAPPGLLDDPNE